MIYPAAEDSYLLSEFVKKLAFGAVLDVGSGSGVQSLAALKSNRVKSVIASDIDDETINYLKRNIHNSKMKIIKSDIFSKIKNKFDTIIFNPPYLPADESEAPEVTRSTAGGKHGYEILERFFSEASDHLKPDGIILIVFSSLTKRIKVDESIYKYGFEYQLLKTEKIPFEELYVYKIVKSPILKQLESKNIKNIHRFAKGHRGFVYVGQWKGRKIAVKVQRKDVAAQNRVNNEINIIKKLNKYKIGPKLLFYGKDWFAYEFVEGEYSLDFFEKNKNNKKRIVKTIKSVFEQCYRLDLLGINKEEMHRPIKNLIITKKGPVFIDFERAHYTKDPKNVTQFVQFVISLSKTMLKGKIRVSVDNIIRLSRIYKHNINKNNYNDIINSIK